MIETLSMLADQLADLEIPYDYGSWKSDIQYPYFVGNYRELENRLEDGNCEGTFTLYGWYRGENELELIQNMEKIKKHFRSLNLIKDDRLFYVRCTMAETLDKEEDLHRCVMLFNVQRWENE